MIALIPYMFLIRLVANVSNKQLISGFVKFHWRSIIKSFYYFLLFIQRLRLTFTYCLSSNCSPFNNPVFTRWRRLIRFLLKAWPLAKYFHLLQTLKLYSELQIFAHYRPCKMSLFDKNNLHV